MDTTFSRQRTELVLEYGRIMLDKLKKKRQYTEAEVARMKEIQGAVGLIHDALVAELEGILTGSVGR